MDWNKLFRPRTIGAIGIVVVSILTAARGDYEASVVFLCVGAFVSLFVSND